MAEIRDWAPLFAQRTRQRGRVLFFDGQVEQRPTEAEQLLAAAVTDGMETHHVDLSIREDGMVGRCSCDEYRRGVYCPHIWATLLDLLHNGPATPTSESTDLPLLPPEKPDAETSKTGGSSGSGLARARKRNTGRPLAATVRREPTWSDHLALLATRTANLDELTPSGVTGPRLIYLIQPRRSARLGQLVVALRQSDGGRGRPESWKPFIAIPDTLSSLPHAGDRRIVSLLLGGSPISDMMFEDERVSSGPATTIALPPHANRMLLRRMIETGRCFVETPGEPSRLIKFENGPAWVLWAVGVMDEESLSFDLELRRGEEQLPIALPTVILGGDEGIVIGETWAGPFDDRDAGAWIGPFRNGLRESEAGSEGLRVPLDDVSTFLDRLYALPRMPELELPEAIAREEVRVKPIPHLDLYSPGNTDAPADARAGNNQLIAQVWFDYKGHRVAPQDAGRYVPAEGEELLLRRSRRQERLALEALVPLGFRKGSANRSDVMRLPQKRMPHVIETLLRRGWAVRADDKAMREARTPRISVTSGVDWFEMRGQVAFETESGTQTVHLPAILEAVRQGRPMVELDDGSQGMLPQQWLQQQGLLDAIGQFDGESLRFTTNQAALLDTLISRHAEVTFDEHFAALRDRLRAFEKIEPREAGAFFTGDLRHYQSEGLGWLAFLRWFGLGGILADDMGLGKTIQVLALLDGHYHGGVELNADELTPATGGEHHPTLVVAPRSVCYNWLDEAEKFTPKLRCMNYSGNDRDALRPEFANTDLIVTSYGLMRRDIEQLREHQFQYVILDEAQAIKNPASQSAKAARLLPARHRLALTGTPVENHLGDLWSIMEYLNPGMLGSSTKFADLFKGTANSRQSAEVARQAGDALRPFILRRTKKQVLAELPEKTEQKIICEMSGPQRKVYNDLLKYYRTHLLDKKSGNGKQGGNTMFVLEALLRLRQAACHPGLIDSKYEAVGSAKFETLLQQLDELMEEGHKALIFSQFTSLLSLLRKRLDDRKIGYEYLDGATRNRKQRIEHFQHDPNCHAFLISLKAGGVGLNLTAANYVFILDPWWNPAAEAQAIDRAHRIGQTEKVTAYRLICADTVEQRIIELQQKKLELAEAVVHGKDEILGQLSRNELERLLG